MYDLIFKYYRYIYMKVIYIIINTNERAIEVRNIYRWLLRRYLLYLFILFIYLFIYYMYQFEL